MNKKREFCMLVPFYKENQLKKEKNRTHGKRKKSRNKVYYR